jgi:hypothetical protein
VVEETAVVLLRGPLGNQALAVAVVVVEPPPLRVAVLAVLAVLE